jgi:hypothetical protein
MLAGELLNSLIKSRVIQENEKKIRPNTPQLGSKWEEAPAIPQRVAS